MQDLQSDILAGLEITPASPPQALVILLHGLGSNGADLMSLAPHYGQLIGGDIAYLSPHAPFAFDMAPFAGAYQWFSLQGYDPAKGNFEALLPEWEQAVREVQGKLADFIAEQCARFGLTAAETVLIGFSQGTMVSLYASLPPAARAQTGDRFAAIIGYSGALVGQADFVAATASGASALPPYLLLHGEADDVVPCTASRRAAEFLQSVGADVELQTYPNLPHSINEEGIIRAANFIKEKLAIS